MTTWAGILKDGNPTKDARHGSVDINENKELMEMFCLGCRGGAIYCKTEQLSLDASLRDLVAS